MKILFDYLPIAAFLIGYYFSDDEVNRFFFATQITIIASLVQIAVWWLLYRRVERMHLISMFAILLLGGATLLTQDKRFLFWKPTVVYWLLALVFLASQFIGNKLIVQRMMEQAVQLPAWLWKRLHYAWVLFFLAMGVLNILIAFNFSEEAWVNFKLFGTLGLTIVFCVLQVWMLGKHIVSPDSGGENTD